jgi:cobalt/nickel transport system permease protein
MSRRSYSKHVPDIRMITHHAETGTSRVHAMNPWTKAVLLLVVVALVTVATDLLAIAALYIFSIGFYAAARLPVRLLAGWYTLPMVFVVTLAIMFVFTEPGDDLVRGELGPVSIGVTDNGLLLMAKLVLRALAVVTFSLTVFMTTRYRHVVYLARRMLPGVMSTMFLLTYRFLFVTTDQITDVLDAVHSKNGALVRGVTRQSRLYAGIFAHAFIRAFERAERVSKAMESRGFTGEFPVTDTVPHPGAGGVVTIIASLAVLSLAVVDRYVWGVGV